MFVVSITFFHSRYWDRQRMSKAFYHPSAFTQRGEETKSLVYLLVNNSGTSSKNPLSKNLKNCRLSRIFRLSFICWCFFNILWIWKPRCIHHTDIQTFFFFKLSVFQTSPMSVTLIASWMAVWTSLSNNLWVF